MLRKIISNAIYGVEKKKKKQALAQTYKTKWHS